MERHPVNRDLRSLEEAFFADENAKLLERLREKDRLEERRRGLREVAPNADDALIDQLIALDVTPSAVLALILTPLAFVAWADGEIDRRERVAILEAAANRGVAPGSAAHQLLDSWLEREPRPELLETWKRYVASIWSSFDPAEQREMRERMAGLARSVAEAAGSFLGITSGISAAERAVLDEIEKSLP